MLITFIYGGLYLPSNILLFYQLCTKSFPNLTFRKQQSFKLFFAITGNYHLKLAIDSYNWQLLLITVFIESVVVNYVDERFDRQILL